MASGVAIYNITNPTLPHRVGFFPGPPSIWRESKSYRNWIYVVTEGTGPGEGVQIIRMTNPEAPVLAATYKTDFTHSHTVSVDTARAILICNGTRDSAGINVGMHVLSIANPEAPVELARWPAAPYDVPSDQYVHDSVPMGNRLYAASIYSGEERVFDFTQPSAPTLIASWTYPGAYYTHNSWPDATGNHVYVTDEQNGQPLRVFDISNLASPQLVDGITSNPRAIVHNAHVYQNELYLSNYTEGIRVLDLSDPAHPAEFGWADSYPGISGGYSGVWEVCPFFPSGTVIASDMETGLYVYQPQRNYGLLRARVVDAGTGQPMAGIRVKLTTQGDSLTTPADGIVQFAPSPGTHTVLAHAFGYVDASATRTVSLGSRDTVVLALALRPTATFTGSVRDSGTDLSLDDAEVALEYTPLHDHTDATGVYALAGVPDDFYRVDVRRAGYVPISFVRRIGPGYPGTDYRLRAAHAYLDLESGAGWTVGAAGDQAIQGIWTHVKPQGSGDRPPGDEAAAVGAPVPGVRSTSLRSGEVSPLRSQHEEPAVVVTDNAAPYFDHTPGAGTMCFVTGQGTDTSNVDQADLDGGQTTLTSPAFDLTGLAEPTIGYWRWFYSRDWGTGQPDPNDWLAVLISHDDGATWVPVDTTRGVFNRWQERAIRVADYVTPTTQVRLRFVAADFGYNSLTEAAVDDITVYEQTGAAGVPSSPPTALRFRAPTPNPFSSSVVIMLEMPAAARAQVEVLDVSGRQVRTVADRRLGAGIVPVVWDGRDDQARAVPAGIYFVRARVGGSEARTRVVRIR